MVGDNLRALLDGLKAARGDPQFRGLIGLTALLVATASLFYRLVEGWQILDSLYFSVITLATIGYGDFAPKTDAGKIFTMFYALLGIEQQRKRLNRISSALLQACRPASHSSSHLIV